MHNCTFFLRKHKCTFFSWENKIAIVIHSVLSSTHNCTFFWVLHIQLSHSLAKKRFHIKNRELFCILKSKMLLYYFQLVSPYPWFLGNIITLYVYMLSNKSSICYLLWNEYSDNHDFQVIRDYEALLFFACVMFICLLFIFVTGICPH